MLKRNNVVWIGVLILLIAAAGCTPESLSTSGDGQQTKAATAQAAGDTAPVVTVNIKDFKFAPEVITAPPGARIVFVNHDETPHNVVQGTATEVSNSGHQPDWSSPELAQGNRWELVLNEVGEYDYACTTAGHYLIGMAGKIIIEDGAEVADTGAAEVETVQAAARDIPMSLSLDNLPEGLVATPERLVELEPFNVEGNVKEFAIDVQEVEHELIDGVVVTAWAFNGTLPGPTLRVDEGDYVKVHFTNTHHQPHTIHWHGIYADQKFDGVPHTSKQILPGETYVYEFAAERAGTYMYHCHVDSYRHIDMGMYGALIIDPKEKTWDHEYTLVLDDWDSDIEPLAQHYEPDHNYFLINGKAFPDLPSLPLKVGETTRIRLINAGYSNFSMHLHGPHFTVKATDSHDLPMPYNKDTLDVAPGERYDIEVTPTKAGAYPFHAHNIQYVRNNGFYPGGMHIMIDIED